MSTTFDLRYKAVTSCPAPAVLDYEITVAAQGGAVLETLTAASVAAATAGVTLTAGPAGGLPLIQVDEALLAQDIAVTYVSFTTDCGLALVGDVSLHNVDTGAGPAAGLVGCQAFGPGATSFSGRWGASSDAYAVTGSAASHEIWIGPDQRLWGAGRQLGGYGLFGVSNVAASVAPNDPNVYGGYVVDYWTRPRTLANFDAYQPDERFVKVMELERIGFALSTTGKLWTWGHDSSAEGTDWRPVQARNGAPASTNTLIEALTPFEIVAPNGLPWARFETAGNDASLRGRIYAATTDGTWYSWGIGSLGSQNLGHQTTETSGLSEVDVPTEITAWPLLPSITLPPEQRNIITFNTGYGLLFIDTNGDLTMRWPGSTAQAVYGGDPAIFDQVQLPAGVKAASFVADSVYAHILILGDDGLIYFAGQYGRTTGSPNGGIDPTGATGQHTGMTAIQISMASVPAGVTFTKICSVGASQACALGSDGRAYTFNPFIPPTAYDIPGNADIIDLFTDRFNNMFWMKADRTDLVAGQLTPGDTDLLFLERGRTPTSYSEQILGQQLIHSLNVQGGTPISNPQRLDC